MSNPRFSRRPLGRPQQSQSSRDGDYGEFTDSIRHAPRHVVRSPIHGYSGGSGNGLFVPMSPKLQQPAVAQDLDGQNKSRIAVCEVCKFSFTNAADVTEHFSSEDHRIREKILKGDASPPGNVKLLPVKRDDNRGRVQFAGDRPRGGGEFRVNHQKPFPFAESRPRYSVPSQPDVVRRDASKFEDRGGQRRVIQRDEQNIPRLVEVDRRGNDPGRFQDPPTRAPPQNGFRSGASLFQPSNDDHRMEYPGGRRQPDNFQGQYRDQTRFSKRERSPEPSHGYEPAVVRPKRGGGFAMADQRMHFSVQNDRSEGGRSGGYREVENDRRGSAVPQDRGMADRGRRRPPYQALKREDIGNYSHGKFPS